MAILNKIFGDTNARAVRAYEPIVAQINALESSISQLTDDGIRGRIKEIRAAVEGSSERLDGVTAEVFALTREAAKRTLGQRHYDVQLIGGLVLHAGKIAEMRTGEGKTLVATLPVALNALIGNGVHVVTVNDYLAKRDAGWMGQVYYALGLSCAAIVHERSYIYDPAYDDEQVSDPLLKRLRPVDRREAYRADITYGTNNEFGFDYLRDNMAPSVDQLVQRKLQYAIVDEVDSILIDEARTPLIISAPVERSSDEYRRIDGFVKQLEEDRDYKVDEKLHSVFPTEEGISKLERMLGVQNLYASAGASLLNIINQSLKANSKLFIRDKQYVVRDGEIVIVDEFTGRLMFGRRYSEGLHQSIEAKEGVDIKQESQTLATITFQNLFRLYVKLAGMTGTAATEAEEFHKIYNLDVVLIPTNKPTARTDSQDSVYKNELGKFTAVVREIKNRHEQGQPVLAGTISIAKNEILSELLSREGVPHEVLNAKNHEREAQIIAQAGRKGAVTIATNMAGRGVDIILGGNPPVPAEQDEVRSLGGLHVIGTERHESRRIDLQLRGRSGRQGDPGSSQFFVSMEDDLMRIFGSDRMKNLMDRLGIPDDMPIENRMISRSIESAQKKVEGHNFDIRKHLVEYDDVMNKHREVIYRRRRDVLHAPNEEMKELALGIVEQELETIVALHLSGETNKPVQPTELANSLTPVVSLNSNELQQLEDRLKSGRTAV
ncbi:MAG: preprotein translocase subunit SecA, partial [Candidatus Kerfeldbacteria bacterium]|nr:preprotein translocase subunit SecA [Candidatus Kerfeldbacteria bacterium]